MKDRKITFRVTQEEYDLIDSKKQTEKHFVYGGRWDMSAYIRNLVLSQSGGADVRIDKELSHLNYEIRKIGVNINQIAHKLNANYGDPRDAQYVMELMTELTKTVDEFRTYRNPVRFLYKGGVCPGNNKTYAYEGGGRSSP